MSGIQASHCPFCPARADSDRFEPEPARPAIQVNDSAALRGAHEPLCVCKKRTAEQLTAHCALGWLGVYLTVCEVASALQ